MKLIVGYFGKDTEVKMIDSILNDQIPLCGCGCSNYVKQGRKYIQGHQNRGRKRPDIMGDKNLSKRPEVRKRRSEANLGKNNPSWKGGKAKSGGYITILIPSHPFADVNGRVKEERLIMESHIGRYLTNNEIVHHKNEIKSNNEIENLQIVNNLEHMRVHRYGKPRSNETKRKISMTLKGRKLSEEHKIKMSKSISKWWRKRKCSEVCP